MGEKNAAELCGWNSLNEPSEDFIWPDLYVFSCAYDLLAWLIHVVFAFIAVKWCPVMVAV